MCVVVLLHILVLLLRTDRRSIEKMARRNQTCLRNLWELVSV